MIHDFHKCLAFSEQAQLEPFWEQVYRKAFPTMHHWEYCKDLYWQLKGVDRTIYLNNGHQYHIDEKIREKVWPDILLEHTSNNVKKSPGWMEKDLNLDFFAYAFLPIKTVYLFSWPLLRTAWIAHRDEWKSIYKMIASDNGWYYTYSVAIPIPVLLQAVSEATIIKLP